jgi:hypothetical protein
VNVKKIQIVEEDTKHLKNVYQEHEDVNKNGLAHYLEEMDNLDNVFAKYQGVVMVDHIIQLNINVSQVVKILLEENMVVIENQVVM